MKQKLTFLMLLMFIICGKGISAQTTNNSSQINDTANYPYWIEMMQDPTVNFFDVQRAFNIYWKDRKITRGCGWKPFKRWENFMSTRVDSKGNRPLPNKIFNEYLRYKKKNSQKSPQGDWHIIGPVYIPQINSGQPIGMGRVNEVAFHPTNPNVIFIGSPSGGLWRSDNNGQTWNCLSDNLPTLGVSAIVVDYVNPNIIYIGTGDRDASDAPGLGVMKSTDAGRTWSQANNGMGDVTVAKIIMDPKNNNVLYAATSSGIYKTTDGGVTWVLKSSGYYKDIVFKPFEPNIIYASRSGGFYRSENSGDTWKRIFSGLLPSGREVIGVSKANPNYVYCLLTNQRSFKGLYLSTDSGLNFTNQSTTPNIMGYQWNGSDDGGQAWYDLCFAVDPKNENILYVGGVNVFKSTDAGKTWKINSHWVGSHAPAVHADHHVLKISPINNYLYDGNDGGIYYTNDGGSTWNNVSSGLAISQVYRIGQSATVKDLVINGYQDNGTSVYENGVWKSVIGGDGMDCLVDYSDSDCRYGELYYGSIKQTTNGTYFHSIAGNGILGINEEGDWVTPFILHETDPNTMFIGYENIWRSKNVKSYSVSWKNISSVITNPNHSKIKVVEQSPANTNILYFARADSKLFRSDNVNSSSPEWKQLGNAPYSLITDIEADPNNENIVYATFANNRIYESTDKGDSWTNITGNLPQVSLNCIIYDKNSDQGLYVGTDIGVFYKNAFLKDWVLFNNGFPASARVTDLGIYHDNDNPSNSVIRASTYGRGLWESDLYSDEVNDSLDVQILSIKNPVNNTYCINEKFTPTIYVKNRGFNTIDSLTVSYRIDAGNVITKEWKGNLTTHQTATINFSDTSATVGNHILTAYISLPNGEIDQDSSNNQVTNSFSVYYSNVVTLNLTTDSLASQTTWDISDTTGTILYSGVPYSNDSVYDINQQFCLAQGCYQFNIYDSNNDGICCSNGNGKFELVNSSLKDTIIQGGSFQSHDSVLFCISSNGVNPDFFADTTQISIDSTVIFSDNSTGDIISYNWNFGEDAIPQTASTQGPHNVIYSSGGNKNIVLTIKDSTGTFTQAKSGYLTVYDTPVIVTQPIDNTKCANESVTFKTLATGQCVKYQWEKDGNYINGATSSYYKIDNLSVDDAGRYSCMVYNKVDSIYSDTALLTVNSLPNIIVKANPSTLCGTKGTSILKASGADSYVWSSSLGTKDSVEVTPNITTTYSVTGTTNGCSLTRDVTVNVASNPVITKQPDDITDCLGNNVLINVGAMGLNLNYQWIKNNITISGATNSVYSINNISNSDSANYYCKITNECGNINSDTIHLSIRNVKADFIFSIDNNRVYFTDKSTYADSCFWNFGDTTYSTICNPYHDYKIISNFNVLHIAYNDCGVDSVYKNINITGVNDIVYNDNNVRIYPNPSNGYFNLEFISNDFGNIFVAIYNISGKEVYSKNIIKNYRNIIKNINIRNLKSGIYQLRIISQNKVINKKIIIK